MQKTKSKPLPKFLTVAEICEALRITRWTVYRMIENGDLESKRFGRNVRITRDSFERLVENA